MAWFVLGSVSLYQDRHTPGAVLQHGRIRKDQSLSNITFYNQLIRVPVAGIILRDLERGSDNNK